MNLWKFNAEVFLRSKSRSHSVGKEGVGDEKKKEKGGRRKEEGKKMLSGNGPYAKLFHSN